MRGREEVPEGYVLLMAAEEVSGAPLDQPDSHVDVASAQTSATRQGRKWLHGRPLMWGSAATALVCAGAVLGWWLGATHDASLPTPTPSVRIVEVPAAITPGTVMPDLRGLDKAAALQILADLGVPAEKITATDAPAAGASGLVFMQTPVRGSSISGDVTLVVSAPAVVPKVVGGGVDTARQELSKLGAEVAITRTYRAGAASGSILAVDPAEGTALPAKVALTVADASSSVFAADVRTLSGSVSTQDVTLAGQAFRSAAILEATTEGRAVAWVTGQHVDGFRAMVGIPDSGKAGSQIEVTVLADGVAVATVQATFGNPQPLFVPLSGRTQVEIRARSLTAAQERIDAAMGDARFIGGPELAQQLGTRQ